MNCEHSSTRILVTALSTRHPASLCVIYFGNRKFAKRLLLAATVAVFVLGWIATDRVTAGMVNHDPSWIVIDEVAGQWSPCFRWLTARR